YDALAVGEAIYSVDDSTSAADRFFQIVSPAGTWLASSSEPWDGTYSWPSDSFRALAYDGTAFYAANDWASSVPAQILTFPLAGGNPTATRPLGADFRGVAALTADATYFYWIGASLVGGTGEGGVFRMRKDPL